MSFLTKEEILKTDDIRREEIYIEEWGGSIFIQEMTGTAKDNFELESMSRKGQPMKDNFRTRFLVKCIVDKEGSPLFTEKDISSLGKKSGTVIDRIFQRAGELNGLFPNRAEKAKNSEAAK